MLIVGLVVAAFFHAAFNPQSEEAHEGGETTEASEGVGANELAEVSGQGVVQNAEADHAPSTH